MRKNTENVCQKYAKITIWGTILDPIWSAVSRGGGSFWRPVPRTSLGAPLGRFWLHFGLIWEPFCMTLGCIFGEIMMYSCCRPAAPPSAGWRTPSLGVLLKKGRRTPEGITINHN